MFSEYTTCVTAHNEPHGPAYQVWGDRNVLEEWNTKGLTYSPWSNLYCFNTSSDLHWYKRYQNYASLVNDINILRIPFTATAVSKMLFLLAQCHLILSRKKKVIYSNHSINIPVHSPCLIQWMKPFKPLQTFWIVLVTTQILLKCATFENEKIYPHSAEYHCLPSTRNRAASYIQIIKDNEHTHLCIPYFTSYLLKKCAS